ncbi:hypothetical protein BLNAU_12347 [Blattamonas nauphoetae]|uniref:Uncharacterized protein n=1 Tax=Blattamonas nauphoetae TaxID=2049346 RepID=A0ABQ9XMX7_9EUKA|nr:hypothetical protein BLNAU_12347 [Blattamonas nauphoetae]
MIDLHSLIDLHTEPMFFVGLSEVYRASEVLLKSRTVTLVGKTTVTLLDLETEFQSAFRLTSSTLKLITLTIKPSRFSSLATAENDSEMSLDRCIYSMVEFCQSILVGERSKLVLSSFSMSFVTFRASMIAGTGSSENPRLSISLSSCMIDNALLVSQFPIIGGTDIETITVSNSSFSNITVLEDPSHALERAAGVPSRRIEVIHTSLHEISGPLSGTLFFGVQAHSLKLALVSMTDCSNAAPFWESVVFPESSEVSVDECAILGATTTPFQPNGSFLFLCNPHTTMTLNSSSFAHCTASEDGGCIWTSSQARIEIENCTTTNCSAGGRGGFVCSTGHRTTFAYNNSTSVSCSAGGQGGSLFVAGLASFSAIWGTFENCYSGECGGGVALVVESHAALSFSRVDFRQNEAEASVGNDVAVTFTSSPSSPLTKKDLKTCWSTSATPKVSLLPTSTHIDWANPLRPDWLFPTWLIVLIVSLIPLTTVVFLIIFNVRDHSKKKKTAADGRRGQIEDEKMRRVRKEKARGSREGEGREGKTTQHDDEEEGRLRRKEESRQRRLERRRQRREQEGRESGMKREVDGVAETENRLSSLKDGSEQASLPPAHPRSSSYCPPQPPLVPTLLTVADGQCDTQLAPSVLPPPFPLQ